MNKKLHWETIYETKQPSEVSWTQVIPEASLRIIENCELNSKDAIIDIGGGDSNLIPQLANFGYTNLSLLDISARSLMRAKAKLVSFSGEIDFIEKNISDFVPEKKYTLWHDRALFHFLTNQEEIDRYVQTVNKSVLKYLIVATFSKSGPKKCSGISIKQYDKEDLVSLFSENFYCEKSFSHDHKTPSGNIQNFTFCLFERKTNS